MNEFDALLLDGLGSVDALGGFFKKIRKKVKRVGKKITGSVKKVTSRSFKNLKDRFGNLKNIRNPKTFFKNQFNQSKEAISIANQARRDIRQITTPKSIREFENTTSAKVANNKVFRVVATAVATFYGFGLVADAAFAGLDAYNVKMMRKQKPSPADKKAFHDSLQFLKKMTVDDQEKILSTLSPLVAAQARSYLNKFRSQQPKSRVVSTAEQAAFNAGQSIGTSPEIRAVIQRLMSDGKTPAEIETLLRQSNFYKATATELTQSTLTPLIQPYYGALPNAHQLAEKNAKTLGVAATTNTLTPYLLSTAAIAGLLLL